MNKVLHGDCLELMKELPDKSVDMILCDLPYGTTACKWDVIIPFDDLWLQYKRIIKDNSVIVLFGSEPFSSHLRISNLDWYKYDWIWEKNNAGNFQLVKSQPLKIHENISVFYSVSPNMEFANIIQYHMKRLCLEYNDVSKLEVSKMGNMTGWLSNKIKGMQLPTKKQWIKLCHLFGIESDKEYEYDKILQQVKRNTYNLIDLKDVNILKSNKNKSGNLGHVGSESKRSHYIQKKSGYPRSILKYNRECGKHPTQKPVALLEYLIKTYTNEGDLVLDNCAGSGTTAIACLNTKRNYVLMEKEQKYFDIINERIDSHKKKNLALLLE